jgi:hypothetical protein
MHDPHATVVQYGSAPVYSQPASTPAYGRMAEAYPSVAELLPDRAELLSTEISEIMAEVRSCWQHNLSITLRARCIY